MAYTSEIEKLERRWAENPKGRNFAPLADAYRKAGELDRAIELCKNGLELHPDYVSAYIVYGRCLIDQKNDSGAVEVFQKVLTLDPENILALKVLAEIAERVGRYDEG
ncbi:MAG TPA: tetratricopeptide repeat protein, partial [Gemmatimonadales bacterium]|nr:tetratricopeptide repeat protein [Gemmatimonadales bacterium]